MPFPPNKMAAYKDMRSAQKKGPPGGGPPKKGPPGGGGGPPKPGAHAAKGAGKGAPPIGEDHEDMKHGHDEHDEHGEGGGLTDALAEHGEQLETLADEFEGDLGDGVELDEEEQHELESIVAKVPAEVREHFDELKGMDFDAIEEALDHAGGEGELDHNLIAGFLFHASRL